MSSSLSRNSLFLIAAAAAGSIFGIYGISRKINFLSLVQTNKKTFLITDIIRNVLNFKYSIDSSILKLFGLKGENGGTITKLRVYPLKSVGKGIEVDSWEIDKHGLKFDREYTLATFDKEKNYYNAVTLRTHPRLASVKVEFIEKKTSDGKLDGLFKFTYPLEDENVENDEFEGKSFFLPCIVTKVFLENSCSSLEPLTIELWGVKFETITIDKFLPEDFIKGSGLPEDIVLLYTEKGKEVKVNSPHFKRFIDLRKDESDGETTDSELEISNSNTTTTNQGDASVQKYRRSLFQDYYPILLVSLSDVNDLNKKISQSEKFSDVGEINPFRFRPNILINNNEKLFDIDTWSEIIIHSSKDGSKNSFSVPARSARCTMPNVNLTNNEMDKRYPITNILSKYRRIDPDSQFHIFFGVYLNQLDSGFNINVGDKIEVIKRKITVFQAFY
ncbi:hypothetical protein BVG19_g2832 [[Candida] boidinii]|nr:hypothetical protein BVG19_g2832 [[Candida] boidinii]OWB48560.1 hypothetical protein B5S27_g95 [[Candida] boidinii]